MATFTNLENAHVFSKAVITPSMSAAAAGNTSAHTIQSKDTWAEAVPFLEKSDLSNVSTDKEFKIEGYGTVKFHYKKNVYCLIHTNNNDVPSDGYVGKIIDNEGNTINQFISPTDVVNSKGQMATVYQPSLYDSEGESMPLSDYIINPSNGLIYDLKSTGDQGIFATSATDGKTEYKLSFFTYEGAKLDTTITNIKSSINQNKEELSGKIDNVETDISTHVGKTEIHVSEEDRELWDKGGNMTIGGDNFITPEKTDTGWSLSLNNSTVIDSSNEDGNKKVPTVNAVKNYTDALFENKVEALPSVYTGNNEAYINCYGFEYTDPSENIIFDKIEIKFAKNLDTLTKLTIADAPEISAEEIENNICKITVAKVKTPTDAEIEIATSDYNANISNEVDLSQFKFSKNIILEKGWNYRFYFYDKDDNLFAAPVIVNTIPIGDSLLPRNSVANRWLSERYDYWGAYNFKSTGLGVAANGLAVKLINAVQEHINDADKHVTEEERELWNKGGNMAITGDNFITPSQIDSGWNISLNTVSSLVGISDDNSTNNVPTSNAVKSYVDSHIIDPTSYIFNDLPGEDRKYYMIFDAWQNPVYISDAFKKELTTGNRLFDYRSWEKFHIDMPYLETQSERMFHNNLNLVSFKSDLSSLTRYNGFFHGDLNLEYVDIILTDKEITSGSNCFTGCNKLKYVKITCNNTSTIDTFLSYLPSNTDVKYKKLIIGKIEDGKFKKYLQEEIPGSNLNNLIEAGWSFNN